MRIFIQVLGTRGDVEIFLILARALLRRGHEVVIGTSPFYAEGVTAAGADWVPVGHGRYEELAAILRSLSRVDDQRQRVAVYVEKWLRPQLSQGSDTMSDYTVNNTLPCIENAAGAP